MCTRGIRVKQLIIVLIQFTLQYKMYMFGHLNVFLFLSLDGGRHNQVLS